MGNIEAAQFVFDQHSFRIGALFWLATCNDGEKLPDELQEAADDGDLDTVWDEHLEDPSMLAEWLIDNRKLGFLARIETPCPIAVHKNGYSTSGWGMYTTDWLYAETLDELLAQAASISEKYIKRECDKLRKKQAA